MGIPVVYGDWSANLVFLREERAVERVRLFYALQNARTWGEFRGMVAASR